MTPKAKTTKEEIRKTGLRQNLKLSCFKEHHQDSKRITPKLGENFCKWLLDNGLYLEYIKNSYDIVITQLKNVKVSK